MMSIPKTTQADNRMTEIRVRVRVPRQYHHDPIISTLSVRYGIQVNISAALLTASGQEDGWFDLLLQGSQNQIHDALAYLNDLNFTIWLDGDREGW